MAGAPKGLWQHLSGRQGFEAHSGLGRVRGSYNGTPSQVRIEAGCRLPRRKCEPNRKRSRLE